VAITTGRANGNGKSGEAQLKEQVYQIVEFDLRVDFYGLLDDEAHAH
jgi:hypothetical protein